MEGEVKSLILGEFGGFWAAALGWLRMGVWKGLCQAQLLPCAGTESPQGHLQPDVPWPGWQGPHMGQPQENCPKVSPWALLQQSSGASAEMLCWIKFQQRNLSEVFYLYPCTCQGDLNPSRNFCGKCVSLVSQFDRFIVHFSCSYTFFFLLLSFRLILFS